MDNNKNSKVTVIIGILLLLLFVFLVGWEYQKQVMLKEKETKISSEEVIDIDVAGYTPRDFPSVEGKPYVVWCENEETLEIEEDCSIKTELKPGEALAVSFDLRNLFASLGRENPYEEFYFCYSSDLLENNVTPLTPTCSMPIQNGQEAVVPDLFVPYLNEGTEINLFSLRIYPVREIGQLIDDPDDPQKIELINIKAEIMGF